MKRLKEFLINTGLISALLLVSFLVGGVFAIIKIFLVYYLGWYIWGNRITTILFVSLVIYIACKIPWDSPKDSREKS